MRGLTHAVLLVDAPELHLSEDRARDLAVGLVELFGSENQIVFGTRSAKVAGAFPASQVLRVE